MPIDSSFVRKPQLLCGWLSLRHAITRLLAAAMFLYAAGLAILTLLHTHIQLWISASVFGVAAGFVTVSLFAVWGLEFGRARLGCVQGTAQMLTVFASALGPLLFAKSHAAAGCYSPLCQVLSVVVLIAGLVAWWTKLVPAAEETR